MSEQTFLVDVVRALSAGGARFTSSAPDSNAWGTQGSWRLDGPLDRARVEMRLDLGALAWWHRTSIGTWVLADAVSDGVLQGDDRSAPSDGIRPLVDAARVRLGYAADDPTLQRPWAVPSPEAELAALDGASSLLSGPLRMLRMPVGAGGCQQLLARVREVLSVALPALAEGGAVSDVAPLLPQWFLEEVAAERTPAKGGFGAGGAWEQVPGERRVRALPVVWTAQEWLRTLTPGERLWWIGEVSSRSSAVDVVLLTPRRGVANLSASWLFERCGATGVALVPLEHLSLLPLRLQPPEVPVRADGRRDLYGLEADLALASVASILGVPSPVALEQASSSADFRTLRLDRPVDTARLDREVSAPPWLRWGSTAQKSYVTNGWNTMSGPAPVSDG